MFWRKTSIHLSTWPKVEGEIVEEEIILPIQVNGKLRDTIKLGNREIGNRQLVEKKALESEKVKNI